MPIVKSVPERQGDAQRIPDSVWGNDWLGDQVYWQGGRQDKWQSRTDFPLGPGGLSDAFWTRPRVPQIPPPPPPWTPPTHVTPGYGGDPPPDQGVVPMIPVSWQEWIQGGGTLPPDWNQYPMASDHPIYTGVGRGVGDGLITGSGDDVTILGDIYDTIDESLGGILPGGVPWTPGTPTGGYYTPPGLLANQPPPGGLNPAIIPPVGSTVAYNQCDDPMRGMVYKKVCGQFKWVKQKRRRRRSLASDGDIRMLSALKGVLGNGKALQSWIAVNSRR